MYYLQATVVFGMFKVDATNVFEGTIMRNAAESSRL